MTYHRGKSVLVCSLGEVARRPMVYHLENSSLGLSLQSPWKSKSVATESHLLAIFVWELPSAICIGKNLVVGVFVKSWSTNWPHWCRERNKFSDDHNKDGEDNEGMLIRNLIMSLFVKKIVLMMVMMMMMNTTCITIIVNWAASWPSFLCTVVLTNNNHNHHQGFFHWANTYMQLGIPKLFYHI